MAVFYVRSTDGNNVDNGSTWALADATLAGSIAGTLAAGDTVYVSDAHAESTAGAVTLNWPGTAAAPVKVICGDDAAEPPTTVTTTGTVTSTGANAITASSASDYVYYIGLTLTSGSGANSVNLLNTGALTHYDSCKLRLGGTSGGTIQASGDKLVCVNTSVRFAAAGSGLAGASGSVAYFYGCSLESGGTSPTALIASLASCKMFIDGFDLSNASASVNITGSTGAGCYVSLRNGKLPASWSGSLHSGTPGSGSVYEMFNCDSGDTNYRYRRATQFGTMQEETTIIRTGGASDGTTGYSLKMVSNANAEYPHQTLDSPEIVKWNDTTGSAVTATIEFVHDSATALKDDEVWMEVMYLGTSGTPLALFVDDAKADVLATAADQTDSSETWTTTGMANPNTRKMSVTFTPQEKGFIHATVKLAKASTTIYYCGKMAVA